MPEVNTQTVHDIRLTEGDLEQLSSGGAINVELDDGSTLKLRGSEYDGSASNGSNIVDEVEGGASPAEVAEDRENVSEDDVRGLVEAAQEEQGNPNMIEKNPDQPDNVEQV